MKLKEVLMNRDGMTAHEADEAISECRNELHSRLDGDGFGVEDICEEYFGLEPDYLLEMII